MENNIIIPKNWKNHVLGQCKSWIDGGLEPRSMTRDLTWGVDVPQEIDGAEGKKLYVWMDAPIGYISSTRAWAKENAAQLENGEDEWKKYWKDESSALVHFVGKDNIVFHCIIFPAILKAAGDYNLPINVPANQFMNLEGRKISTSKNWAVWVHEFCDEHPEHIDSLRYYLIKNMPEQRDSEFTWAGFQEANNSELVNNSANFINRVIVLINKYYGGEVPDFDENESITSPENKEDFTYIDAELLRLYDYLFEIHQRIYEYDFRAALKTVMEISSYGNQLLQNNEPWKTQKTDPEMVRAVMFLCGQIVEALSVVIRPFLPGASDKLREQLARPKLSEKSELLHLMNQLAEGEYILPAGHQINKASHLFSRLSDDWVKVQEQKLHANQAETVQSEGANVEPEKPEIQFDDFVKLDLRAGTILEAEKVKKTDKLMQLTVDMGYEKKNGCQRDRSLLFSGRNYRKTSHSSG